MLDYLRIMLAARTEKMSERGASAVEYGLLIAGIAALIVVVVFAFGLISGVRPHWSWLAIVPLLMILVVFASGIAMMLSAL